MERIIGGEVPANPLPREGWETRVAEDTPLPEQTLTREVQERVTRAKGKVVDRFKQQWEAEWETYRTAVQERRKQPTHREGIHHGRTQKLHAELAKAESSLVVQMRTGVIGFADFLHRMGVPGYETPGCHCGHMRQTAKHILLFCPQYTRGRAGMLRDAGTTDFQTLTSTGRGVKAACRWLINLGILGQYRLAAELLYQ